MSRKYMQTAIAMYCEFTSCVLGFGMHETLPMQTLPTFCVNQADLAFPECPSGLTVHLKASLIPLQRSSHRQMQTNRHWEKDRYQAQKKEKCIQHIETDHIKISSCWSSKSYPDRMTPSPINLHWYSPMFPQPCSCMHTSNSRAGY